MCPVIILPSLPTNELNNKEGNLRVISEVSIMKQLLRHTAASININKVIAMIRRKSTSSENIYLKKNNNNYQVNISKLGRGKGFIPFFKIINEIEMYFVYMAL